MGAAFADADAVDGTGAFIEALREAGPVDWTDQRWYELALDFGRGRYALLVDSDLRRSHCPVGWRLA